MKIQLFVVSCLFLTLLAPTALAAEAGMIPGSFRAGEENEKWAFFFPLFADQALKAGHRPQLPWGVSIQYIYLQQPLEIPGVKLGFNGGEKYETPIKLEDNSSAIHAITTRLDLWILPFLGIYGLAGGGVSSTDVNIVEPVKFASGVSQNVTSWGVGLTGAIGYEGIFAAFDTNITWNTPELLDEPVKTNVTSIRLGYNFPLASGHEITGWVGVMKQKIDLDTSGSVNLSDVVPEDAQDKLDEWYQGLDPREQIKVDALRAVWEERGPDEVIIDYQLDKKLEAPVNMLVGGQYKFSDSWYVRAEFGMIKRWSAMAQIQYRFGLFPSL